MRSLHGATSGNRPWTEEEDALLRTAWGKRPARELASRFPGRTASALYHRAMMLEITTPSRPWTPSEDNHLRDLWGEGTELGRIASLLERTKCGVYARAAKLGLPLGVPAGWEYLSRAGRRTGFSEPQLRRILAFSRVAIHRSLSKPGCRRRAKRPHHIVESFEVDVAIEKWLATEPVETAARRLGVNRETLRRSVRRLGIAKAGGHLRITEDEARKAIEAFPGQDWRRAA